MVTDLPNNGMVLLWASERAGKPAKHAITNNKGEV